MTICLTIWFIKVTYCCSSSVRLLRGNLVLNMLRCSSEVQLVWFMFFKFLSLLSVHFCHNWLSSMSFWHLLYVSSHNHVLSFGFFFPVLLSRSLSCNVRLGGVSSRQSYPSAQYESGLQQGGQQGEQQGHQPRTLLHTSG